MTIETANVVLDSSAVLAWVFGEKGADTVDRLLPAAIVSPANLAETAFVCRQRGYLRPTADLFQDLTALGLRMAEAQTAQQAARAGDLLHLSRQDRQLHGGRTLALGDALCIALGEDLAVPLVTGDTLWKDMEEHLATPVHLFR